MPTASGSRTNPLKKSVELTAGLSGRGDPTDAKGQTFIGGLTPFVPVLIGIDASSLPDPFVQPATSGVVVTPRPGIPVSHRSAVGVGRRDFGHAVARKRKYAERR